MSSTILQFYLKYLLLTLAFELPLMAWIYRKTQPSQALLLCLLMNTLSNPLLNYLLVHHGLNLWLLELGVWVMEAVCIRLILSENWTKAFAVALVLNATSLGFGLGLHALKWI